MNVMVGKAEVCRWSGFCAISRTGKAEKSQRIDLGPEPIWQSDFPKRP